ncbi:hypothetical protein GGR52DRAFT_587063 [Hypoxylon sp. FL1284]|nr:hypothetical protein GGR52DRAFT_587063 [Hypoxylon sp. FL1284]
MAASSSFTILRTEPNTVTSTVVSSSITYTTTFITSHEVVRVYTELPGQSTFVLQSEEWWALATSEAASPSSTAPTIGSSTTPKFTSSPSVSAIPAKSTHTDSSANLSRGAIIGIAVGCAVAGLLLGIIAGLFLFRKRRQQVSRYDEAAAESQEKNIPDVATDTIELDRFLLGSTPDAEIGKKLRSLGHLLRQHVENNYHLQQVSWNVDELSQALLQLGLGQGGTVTTAELASLSLDPKYRYKIIQHVIARVTFASIAFNEVTPFSLLPQPVSSFGSMIPAVEGGRGNADAFGMALTRWRQLSAFLLHPERSERTPLIPLEDVVTHRAQQLAVNLNAFLKPFVLSGRESRYEQENHLREVIAECTTFGYRLFSEPSEYRFRFGEGANSSNLVVCPGLERISDEEGRRHSPLGISVVAPVVEHIESSSFDYI